MILIFTHTGADLTVQRLSETLRSKGAEPLVLDPELIEQLSSFEIAAGPSGEVRCVLRLPERTIELSEVRSALLWRSWRRYDDEPRLQALAARPREWSFYQQEWLTFYRGLVLTLAHHGVFCINPPPFNTAFEEKCCQLFLAAKVGLEIPPTCYTARLPMARAFAETLDAPMIYKPFRTFAHVVETPPDQPARKRVLYTSRVRNSDLVETAGSIPTPSIFQPYIEKAFELRITVVGRQLFSCAIHSQETERTREDWRHYDWEHTPHRTYDLPPVIAQKVLALMDQLGLVYGCVDMIVTPDGRYLFLEVNPNGQFDWIAQLTGMPIYDALADLLLAGGTPA